MELAQQHGQYASYVGSPASLGKLQFDLWGVTPSSRWDWAALKEQIRQHGLRNSLLLAVMPTASTSQLCMSNEACEPVTSNIYSRRVLAGDFPLVNRFLINDLITLGLWNTQVKDQMIVDGGSIQNIAGIPPHIKALYKTVWEISQKCLIDMAKDRGAFICQSQSMNLFIADPNAAKLSSMHFYAWKAGLKTGLYYLRTQPKAKAIQFSVDQTTLASASDVVVKTEMLIPVKEEAGCAMCSA